MEEKLDNKENEANDKELEGVTGGEMILGCRTGEFKATDVKAYGYGCSHCGYKFWNSVWNYSGRCSNCGWEGYIYSTGNFAIDFSKIRSAYWSN